jgi:hypothetical protein
MGNHRFEHHRSHISTSSLIVLEMVVVETYKQHVGVGVTQSLDVGITTTWVETIVVPNKNVVKRGVLIGFTTQLGGESNGVSAIRNLNLVQHYQQLLLELLACLKWCLLIW